MPSKTISYTIKSSIFGDVLIGVSSIGICAIYIGTSQQELINSLTSEFAIYQLKQSSDVDDLAMKVINHIHGDNLEQFNLDLIGTNFQRMVWQQLCKIPLGTRISYTQLARNMGMPDSYRAVANACAKNKIAILVPCHRVVRSDGELAGYRWGLPLKKRLLEIEQS